MDKHNASVLVVGSHGYGAIKRYILGFSFSSLSMPLVFNGLLSTNIHFVRGRAVLGSVSDYCAHHAHCSVMIVKKPRKIKQ